MGSMATQPAEAQCNAAGPPTCASARADDAGSTLSPTTGDPATDSGPDHPHQIVNGEVIVFEGPMLPPGGLPAHAIQEDAAVGDNGSPDGSGITPTVDDLALPDEDKDRAGQPPIAGGGGDAEPAQDGGPDREEHGPGGDQEGGEGEEEEEEGDEGRPEGEGGELGELAQEEERPLEQDPVIPIIDDPEAAGQAPPPQAQAGPQQVPEAEAPRRPRSPVTSAGDSSTRDADEPRARSRSPRREAQGRELAAPPAPMPDGLARVRESPTELTEPVLRRRMTAIVDSVTELHRSITTVHWDARRRSRTYDSAIDDHAEMLNGLRDMDDQLRRRLIAAEGRLEVLERRSEGLEQDARGLTQTMLGVSRNSLESLNSTLTLGIYREQDHTAARTLTERVDVIGREIARLQRHVGPITDRYDDIGDDVARLRERVRRLEGRAEELRREGREFLRDQIAGLRELRD